MFSFYGLADFYIIFISMYNGPCMILVRLQIVGIYNYIMHHTYGKIECYQFYVSIFNIIIKDGILF